MAVIKANFAIKAKGYVLPYRYLLLPNSFKLKDERRPIVPADEVPNNTIVYYLGRDGFYTAEKRGKLWYRKIRVARLIKNGESAFATADIFFDKPAGEWKILEIKDIELYDDEGSTLYPNFDPVSGVWFVPCD